MIEAMSLTQLCALTDGELHGEDCLFSEVSTDTRTLTSGALFVALSGPNFNGNTFVSAAQHKHAAAAMVSESVVTPLPTVRVGDTRIALGRLGQANRRKSQAVVLGLTGSQGKTTVKEMTAAILAKVGAVHATRGNLNNDYGVPLTLLQIDANHEFAVIEMGANAAGEIAYTSALTEPAIAHITNIAETHLEGFGSLEGVAQAKAEIWQGLIDSGKAIVNLDDPNIPGRVVVSNGQQIIGISAQGKPNADYRIADYEDYGLQGSRFTLLTPQGDQEVHLPLPGRHNAANALAAAALAMEAGADRTSVSTALAEMASVKGRMVIHRGHNGAVIIDDSYNASPASFLAAINVLKEQSGLRIVVAGDMGELGTSSEAAHTALGKYIQEQGIELLFATGALSSLAVAAFGARGTSAPDCEQLAAAVLPHLAKDVTVLIKGSRSAGMERVVKQLIKEGD